MVVDYVLSGGGGGLWWWVIVVVVVNGSDDCMVNHTWSMMNITFFMQIHTNPQHTFPTQHPPSNTHTPNTPWQSIWQQVTHVMGSECTPWTAVYTLSNRQTRVHSGWMGGADRGIGGGGCLVLRRYHNRAPVGVGNERGGDMCVCCT